MNYSEIPEFSDPFIHPEATAFGMLKFGKSVSLWPGAVLRADMNQIALGDYVNIQDNSTLHTDSRSPISIGAWSLVGHNVMIHGCTIGRGVLVGIGSIVLDKAVIGDGCQIAAGCMIRGGKKIPPRSLVVPNNGDVKIYEGKAKPELTVAGCIEYAHLAVRFQKGIFVPYTEEEEALFVEQAKGIIKNLGI
ncbi:gamma carbonic anhydrase family protein [Leptospira ilyithenensis]|uniref:Gamma carbonic anhydrase family protein n=1 Tax=Leptospira ilyithenensis TaxID=2484901 RepID=A0A4R9LKL2_9LEPT|nr:gamma carbonic anhydrase family protein [Leptospira ilyithenensis]TGN06544.1 gamma carbonic anhydrase family protein [Leptospira ilyithenensis]